MGERKVTIDVTTSNVKSVSVTNKTIANEITATPDTSLYYSNLAKQWAVKPDGLVVNEDYSSKHYAMESRDYAIQSQIQADSVSDLVEELVESKNEAIEEINTNKNNALVEIGETKTEAITQINTEATNSITVIDNKVENLADKELSNITEPAIKRIEGVARLVGGGGGCSPCCFNGGNVNNSGSAAVIPATMMNNGIIKYLVGGDYPPLVGTFPNEKRITFEALPPADISSIYEQLTDEELEFGVMFLVCIDEDGTSEFLKCNLDSIKILPQVASSAPDTPVDNQLWIDVNTAPYKIKRYDANSASWESYSKLPLGLVYIMLGMNYVPGTFGYNYVDSALANTIAASASMPNYTRGISLSSKTFTMPFDGIVIFAGTANSSAGGSVTVQGVVVQQVKFVDSGTYGWSFFASKNSSVSIGTDAAGFTLKMLHVCPLRGVQNV